MDASGIQNQASTGTQPAVTILAPVYEDWESVVPLLDRLDKALSQAGIRAEVVLVDDGSIRRAGRMLMKGEFVAIGSVKVIRLRANMGHQRAIALGLSWLSENQGKGPTVIMDSDGEDAPEDVPRLIELFNTHQGQKAVFAARSKRSESLVFVICYNIYKVIHLALTGKAVKVGNFSVIPPEGLRRVVVLPELWNHYAATMVKSRFPIVHLPTPRSTRIAGKSTMSFVSLILHGLSGLSVFSDLIGVRMLVASGLLFPALGVLYAAGMAIGLDGGAAGRLLMSGLLILLMVDLAVLMGTAFFIFVILASRDSARMLPARDYRYFIDEVEQNS